MVLTRQPRVPRASGMRQRFADQSATNFAAILTCPCPTSPLMFDGECPHVIGPVEHRGEGEGDGPSS